MKRVILTYKQSTLDMYAGDDFVKKLRKSDTPLYRELLRAHEEHHRSLEKALQLLEKTGIKNIAHERETTFPEVDKDDLVISLGGDGTFIYASHFLRETPLLGINSAPHSSVGFYCRFSILNPDTDAEAELNRVLEKQIAVSELDRLDIRINNRSTGLPVINDFLISEDNPAATSRYEISLNNIVERHRSSGIWFSTVSGSSAAYKSAGGQLFSACNNNLRQFGYIVRELYQPVKADLTGSILNEDDDIQVTSAMAEGRIYVDGSHQTFPFIFGDVLTLNFFEKPLRYFAPDQAGQLT